MKHTAFVGLLLSTVGTALVWGFGLPADVNRKGQGSYILEEEDPVEKRKAAKFDMLSNLGMGLILLGFILQAVAVYCI